MALLVFYYTELSVQEVGWCVDLDAIYTNFLLSTKFTSWQVRQPYVGVIILMSISSAVWKKGNVLKKQCSH